MSTAASISIRHYRFCTPISGTVHEAYTLVGTEDASLEIVLDDGYCLIMKIGNTGDMNAAAPFQLEYDIDDSGSWNPVNATSSNVRVTDTGDVEGEPSTTERLGTSAETFATTALEETDGEAGRSIGGHDEYEFYFAITFRSAELSGGEEITFRMLQGVDTFTHDVTPTATVPAVDEDNISELPNTALTVTVTTHTAVSTDKNISILPSVTLSLAITTHTAVSTDSNFAEGVSVDLTLTNNAPSAESTEHHLSQPPSAVLTLAVTTHTVSTTEKNISTLPSTALTLAVTTHIAEVSEAAGVVNLIPVRVPWTKKPPRNTPINLNHPLLKTLVAAYTFDEVGRLRDVSGHGHHGTVVGSPTLVNTPQGVAVRMDGAADGFSIPDHSELNFNAQDLTVVMGVTPQEGGNPGEFFEKQVAGDNIWQLRQVDAQFAFFVKDTNAFDQAESNTFTPGEYHNVVCRGEISVTDITIWVDGALEGTADFGGDDNWANNAPLLIANGNSGFNQSDWHYFYLFRSAKTSAEIADFNENPWQVFEDRIIWIPVGSTAAGENNTSQLPSTTLTLAVTTHVAVSTDKNISALPNTALTLTVTTHTADSTDKNISELPSTALTLAVTTHTAVSTDSNIAALPSTALALAVTTHQAVSTDNNISQLPNTALALAVTTHQAVSTDKNIAALPSTSLTLAVTTHQTVVTAGETSQLPSTALTLAVTTHQAISTDKNIAALPSTSLTLAVTTHVAVSTDNNFAELPSTALTLAVTTHQAVTTEVDGNLAQLPSTALTLTVTTHVAETTESNIAELPSTALTLTVTTHTVETFDPNTATLPSISLSLTVTTHSAIVSESQVSILPAATLSIAVTTHAAITSDNETSQLPSAALTLTVTTHSAINSGDPLSSTNDPDVIDRSVIRELILIS